MCAGGAGSLMNWRNETAQFCTPSCATYGAACANNLKCTYVDDLSSSTATLGCWMDWSGLNTTTPGTVPFTGGGYPVNVGSPCTASTQCQNPPDYLLGFCATETNAGFPGGMCLADTSYADDSSWCTGAGKVLMWDNNADGGNPEFYYCAQGCTTVGDSTGLRSGYSCWQRNRTDAGVVAVVWPSDCTTTADCSSYATALPQYQWSCNTTAGFCCTGDAGCITTLR